MVFRRFSSLSSGDNDKLSASAMFKSYHKGMWAFATLLYHVIQLSGGLGQALKQSAQRFKSMSWLTKGILFASQEIKSVGVSWVCGPRQKDFGLEGCGKRMSDTWSSEVQKYAYGVMFQSFSFGNLVSWRKLKVWAGCYLQATDCRIIGCRACRPSCRICHGTDLLT